MGLRDILTGRHEVKGPAPDRLFAISTAYIALQSEHDIDPAGTARNRLSGARHQRVPGDARRNGRGRARDGRRLGHAGGDTGRQLRLPLDGPAQSGRLAERRRPGGRHQRGLDLDRGGRPRRAVAVCGVRLHRQEQPRGQRPGLLHLQLQAGLLVPVRAGRRASSSARPSASYRSRRRWPPNSRWSPNSSAGSRSGGFRSRPAATVGSAACERRRRGRAEHARRVRRHPAPPPAHRRRC